MIYAVEAARIDTHECAETAWFETLEIVEAYVRALNDLEWFITIIEMPGEQGDEHKTI